MIPLLSEVFLTAFAVAVVASTMPLMLAALGETVGEQSGVLNLGIEGLLLVGGYFGFVATHATGSFWLGFLAGTAAGVALSAILAVLSVLLGLNQIVVGLGITLLGTGLSSVLYDSAYADSKPRLGSAGDFEVPLLSGIPVLGPGLFAQHGMFTVSIVLAVLVSVWLRRTTGGLRLRAAGQRPASLDLAGGSVVRARALAVLFGGATAGAGGAYLALISAGTFTPGMTHGLGFLAIVVAMLARGRIAWVALGSLSYGLLVSLGTVLQFTGIEISNDLITMVPFIVVMIVLVALGRRSALPAALGAPYVRGDR